MPYLLHPSTPKEKGSFLKNLPYNYTSCRWSGENFDQTYKAKWFPKNIPTMIFSGDHDIITPLECFKDYEEASHPYLIKKKIKNAGHFPWIDNPEEVVKAFADYVRFLSKYMRLAC